MNIIKNLKIHSKMLSLSIKSLAFALGVVATSSSITPIMNITNDSKIESHDHEHSCDLEIENVVVTLDENYEENNEKIYKLIAIKEVENKTISEYKGTSIVEALNLCGIDSSFSNRKEIALSYGINDYRGTAVQNIELLNMLRDTNVDTLAKVVDIETICKDLFGKDASRVIKDLKLPKTVNITKSEFARVIKQIANQMGVDTSTYDNKLGLVIDAINDVDGKTVNKHEIAWAYYMGYADLDKNSNFNGNNLVSINELNNWVKSFTYDYNESVKNENKNAKGLIITPSEDKYTRDNIDTSKINSIRRPVVTPVLDSYTEDNNKHEDNHHEDHGNGKHDDDDDEKHHTHKFSKWSYFDSDSEVSTCNECGKTKYRSHNLTNQSQITYTDNNNGTHSIVELNYCNGCNHNIRKEYTVNCDLGTWEYNKVTGLEERDCDNCGYEETRNHEHKDAPSNLVYTLDKSYNNGTHKLKATYSCDVCEETITLYKDEDCNLGTWEYNKVTGLEERDCDICNYGEKRDHEHEDAPSNLTYTIDRSNNDGTHKLKATYSCDVCEETITLYKDESCSFGAWEEKDSTMCKQECECGYENTKSHTFDVYTSIDDNSHQKSCDCGFNLTETHDYSDWVLSDDGKFIQTCSECNHTNEKEHECQMEEIKYSPENKTADYCYSITEKCSVDGCEVTTVTYYPHELYERENPTGKINYCDCGYYEPILDSNSFSLKRPATLTNEEEPNDVVEDNVIYEEQPSEEIKEETTNEEEQTTEIEEETTNEEEQITEIEEETTNEEEQITEIEEKTTNEEEQITEIEEDAIYEEEPKQKVLVLK